MLGFKLDWLIIGQSLFGLLIGALVGLSISPVVSTVLGLLFAFIGGSLLVLLKGKSDSELELIGKSITALSLFMILGVILGISLRINTFFGIQPPYELTEQLSFNNIKTLGPRDEYAAVVCAVLQDGSHGNSNKKLSASQLQEMIDAGVAPSVLLAMLGYETDCPGKAEKSLGFKLHADFSDE